MARAQGARALMALAFETTYGTPPASGFTRMPFASTSLGAEQPLLNSELLGYGRDPLAPIKDAVTADGDVVVPLDAEAFGFWLKAAFGAPTTTGAEAPYIPRLYGRMRMGGNIIWATDFREETRTTTQGGGKGGGGGKVKTTEYLYYANFAVALCEGPITGIGRIWADGKPMDLSGVTWRWYPGDEAQTADPFIAGRMGASNTPAYRGTAYVVFEELALSSYGNRLPQLSFEVFRPLADPDTAEGLTRAVTMIPASGEFTYATQAIRKTDGGATVPENLNALADSTDMVEALDRLQAMAPAVESVSLVVAWFGDDLRAGACKVRPGVEVSAKSTTPASWSVILAAQAQKHVTHNEALRLLDGLVQLSVLDRDLAAPPASPADGDRYIVASGATGAWAGWDLNVALWTDGAWLRLPPRTGWRAWVEDEGLLLVYDGSSWVGTTPTTLQNMARLGLGTTADASNPFSAKLNAVLWTAKTVAEGGTGDLFYTMNKETAGDDLGLTLQTAYVTKALMGLFGSDRFRLAVSADGSSFFDGLSVDNATGIVDQPRLPRFKAYTNYDNYVGVGSWTKIGLNNTDYNDQGAFDAANNRFVAPADGTYLFGATLLYKINASTTARMRGRLVLNGTSEIRGSLGEISATHVSLATAIWLQTMVPLMAGETVELQGYFRVADGYFAADHTSFWGCKVG